MKAFKVIAEIGSNWYAGDPDKSFAQAMLCTEQAIEAGADIVKFQLFRADTLYSRTRAPKLHERVKNFELPLEWIPKIALAAHGHGRKFWLSIFDASFIPLVVDYVDGLKVASGDATNYSLIQAVGEACASHKKTMAISLGATTEAEVYQAIDTAIHYPTVGLVVFHCVSAYPAKDEDYNLRSFPQFREDVDAIGLSDHTQYSTLAPLALALGYTYFEKHVRPSFSKSELERILQLPVQSGDWTFAMSPYSLWDYIDGLKMAQKALGVTEKAVQKNEESERLWARRGSDGLRPVDGVTEK